MNIAYRAAVILCLCLVVLAGGVIPAARAGGKQSGPTDPPPLNRPLPADTSPEVTASPLSVRVSVEKTHLLWGEPLVLTYVIRRDSVDAPENRLPFEQKQPWLRVRLEDTSGKVVVATGLLSLEGPGLLLRREHRGPTLLLGAKGGIRDQITLGNRRFPIPEPGTYKLLIEITSLWSHARTGGTSPYPSSSGGLLSERPLPPLDDDILPMWAKRLIHYPKWGQEYPQNKTVVVPLMVVREDTLLGREADTIATDLTTNNGIMVGPRVKSVTRLFSFSGSAARRAQLSVVQALAAKHTVDPENSSSTALLYQIGRMGTPEAVEQLADYTWDHRFANAQEVLSKMYYYGDSRLRALILDVFARHGARLPRNITLD